MNFIDEQHVAFFGWSEPASRGFLMVGTLVLLRFRAHGLGDAFARVVLPRPGGPLEKGLGEGFAALLAGGDGDSRRSLTLPGTVNSEKRDGSRVMQGGIGLGQDSEMVRSATLQRWEKGRLDSERKMLPGIRLDGRPGGPPLRELRIDGKRRFYDTRGVSTNPDSTAGTVVQD